MQQWSNPNSSVPPSAGYRKGSQSALNTNPVQDSRQHFIMPIPSPASDLVEKVDQCLEANSSRPLVSVLILTYNHAPYIDECLSSVYSQVTDFDFEVVIGDDCSTDGAQEKLKEWSRRYPQKTRLLLRQHNLGGGGCPNLEATLQECRGAFVALLEGDDYWNFNGKLQAQAKLMRESPGITACTHSTRIMASNHPADAIFRNPQPLGDISLDYLLTVGPPHTSSYMIRRSALERRPPSFRSLPMGDWPLIVHCARMGRVVSQPEGVWSVYRVHSQGSWSARGLINRCRGEIRALKSFEEVLPKQFQKSIKQELLRRQLWLAEGYWETGDRVESIRNAFPAILFWPFRTPATWRQMLKLLFRLVLPSQWSSSLLARPHRPN